MANFKLIDTLPSYVNPDGLTIIDNNDGTYNVLDVANYFKLSASTFGVVYDLRYVNSIVINSTNMVTAVAGTFLSSDVGKRISIEKSFHNPNVADGSEIPLTSLGRIVTGEYEILTVNGDGSSITIDKTLNQTGTVDSYVYTDNVTAIQNAIDFCVWQKVPELVFDGEGIAGFRTIEISDPKRSLIFRSAENSDLTLSGPGKLKLTNENIHNATHGSVYVKPGNASLNLNVLIIPPSQGGLSFVKGIPHLLNCGASEGSVRTIGIRNQSRDFIDTNGKDCHYFAILSNSRGGVHNDDDAKIQYQEFQIENIVSKLRGAGISCFSQNGATNKLRINDVNLDRWSNHFDGEIGREFASDEQDNACQWRFPNLTLSVTSNVVTIDANADFSGLNYTDNPRTIDIEVNGTKVQITGYDSPKQFTVATGLVDGNYTGFNLVYKIDAYGHPGYVHPNVTFDINKLSSPINSFRFYSSGGQSGTPMPSKIVESSIKGFEFNNSGTYNGGVVTIENSTVNCYLGKIDELKLVGAVLTGNELKIKRISVCKDSVLGASLRITEQTEFLATNVEFGLNYFKFEAANLVANFRNVKLAQHSTLPLGLGLNSTITIDSQMNKGIGNLKFPEVTSYPNMTYIIKDVEPQTITGGSTAFRSKFKDGNYRFENYIVKTDNAPGNAPSPDFEPESKYNGVFPITDKVYENNTVRYSTDTYNHLEFWGERVDYLLLRISALLSNHHKIDSVFKAKQLNLSFHTAIDGSVNFGWLSIGLNSLFSGTFFLELTEGGSSELSYYTIIEGNYKRIRNEANTSNVVLKTFSRVDGEIIEFRVDPKQARIVEVGSSVQKKYISSRPIRRGVQNEKLYDSSKKGVYWQNDIVFSNLDGTTYTATLVDKDVNSHSTIETIRTVVLSGVSNLSIFQEKTDGSPYQTFSFSIKQDDNTVLTFSPSRGEIESHYFSFGTKVPHEEYMKNYWVFIDDTNTYQCFINNISGEIVFKTANTGIVLAASDNFTIITGDRISSEAWYRGYDGFGLEQVTTSERNAILVECVDGYEVIDTDENKHYRVINGVWV